MTLIIRALQCTLRALEVVVGKVIAAQIVQVRDTLCGGIETQGRGLSVDAGEHLLRIAKFPTLDQQCQA